MLKQGEVYVAEPHQDYYVFEEKREGGDRHIFYLDKGELIIPVWQYGQFPNSKLVYTVRFVAARVLKFHDMCAGATFAVRIGSDGKPFFELKREDTVTHVPVTFWRAAV